MDTESLVENLIDDGQKLIEEVSQRGFSVTAAFWLKASEDDRWYFYLVSPVAGETGLLLPTSLRIASLPRQGQVENSPAVHCRGARCARVVVVPAGTT